MTSARSALDVARESYRAISLYSPNRAPAAIDLSDNTNLWGVPPSAARAIHEAATPTLTRYPSLYAADLKEAIAAYVGVPAEMIVTGCGSDDVLDSAIRAFGEQGSTIAYPDPSFGMIPIFAQMNALRGVAIPLTPDFDADAEAYAATEAEICYLCSPNNPTGRAFSRGAMERVVQSARGVVIIDEAYAEFARGNCVDLALENGRVLVTRTLSKAFGLAGLRVGYAIGHPALVAEVEKSRGPYKVNGVAQRAAVAALTDDLGWVREHIEEAVVNRERLMSELRKLGLSPIESDANFVLVPVEDACGLDQRMRAGGVAVRPFTTLPRIGDAMRISVGPWDAMVEMLRVLAESL